MRGLQAKQMSNRSRDNDAPARWLLQPADARCSDEAQAGGKGSALARLTQLQVRVPPFVVVSADAYRAMAATGPTAELIEEIRTALERLDAGRGISVRSSAIGEDAAGNSFAGLYHTSLEVRGLDAALIALRRCWDSYLDVAARQYRDERAGGADGAMAVVLQRMAHGEWSGVCFTAHPVKLALSQGLINSVPGLGEALVSGEVNPEEITVAADGEVLERSGAQPGKELPPAAVQAIWQVSTDIAQRLMFPQDVEWTWCDGALYVLQSRPITTIADVYYSRYLEPWRNDAKAAPDSEQRVWSRMLADETWVSPISPLFYNIHNSTPGRVQFFRSHGDKSELPPDIFKYHRATAYADVAVIRRMYEYQPRMARIRGILNFVPEAMREDFRQARWRWSGRLRRMLSYEIENRRMRSFFSNWRYVQQQWPDYIEKSNRWFDTNLDELSLEQLRAHQAVVQKEMAAVGPPCAIAVLSHASDLHLLLTGLLARWCGNTPEDGENLYARISSGLDDSETLRENETLWQLAQDMRDLDESLVAQAQLCNWSGFKARLAAFDRGPALIRRFESFWRDHRHLGSSYKDLIWPRWGDDIDLCFSMLKGYIASQAVRPSEIHARSAESRRKAQRELLDQLRGPLAPVRRSVLRWLFRYNELYMSIRDNHRFFVDRNWYEMRRIYRSYGERLVMNGVLLARDEVFFLGTREVEEALAGSLDAAEAARRIDVRREVWQTTLRSQGPKFLRGWAPFEERSIAQTHGTELSLQGIGASPGSAVGAARVVYDVSGLSEVKDGEILVTRQTDPSWTTVFGRIRGLVLETGGVLSHGTSLCREYGLPCVTAVERATVRIPDGSQIELIGSAGTVRILDAR